MEKIVCIPDSFKGTLSSAEVCALIKESAQKVFPEAAFVEIPVADGGEGTVDAFLSSCGGQKITCPATGPYGEPLASFYGILPDGTAVIEMAAAAGLPLTGDNRHAEKTSTYGVGTLILHALDQGCRRLIIGLGGSATNDGGCGGAAALGARFLCRESGSFVPVGETLLQIQAIDLSRLDKRLRQAEIIIMCDIDNPLCGPRGAAAVFAPQKGADGDTVAMLDKGLSHLAEIVERDLGISIKDLPGAGAAGGMGFGAVAFFKGRLQMGIETVLNAVHFDSRIEGADLVITGEGKLDSQTLGGKVIAGIADRLKPRGIPLLAIVGHIDGDPAPLYDRGLTAVFSINRAPMAFSEAKHLSRENLRATATDLFRLLAAGPSNI